MEKYANKEELNTKINEAVASIEQGETNGLTAMIKNTPTLLLRASEQHEQTRYQPGKQLVTYNGMDEQGNPIQETWGGGVADIKQDSVILKNEQPIQYPEAHELAGQDVKGFYNEDGKFVVDQDNGKTTLFNEYVSDVDFVKGAYGLEAKQEWQKGFKLQPSYMLQIPEETGDVAIITKSGTEINVTGGDYVIIDSKKGKVTSVHGCEKSWLEKTYIDLEEHLKTL